MARRKLTVDRHEEIKRRLAVHSHAGGVPPSSRQPAGLPRVERLEVTDVTGFTIPETNR
jgi:hypothetical protein